MSEVFSDNTIIHPLIKFADRPALTTDQIKEYWTKYLTANIALRTTSFFRGGYWYEKSTWQGRNEVH